MIHKKLTGFLCHEAYNTPMDYDKEFNDSLKSWSRRRYETNYFLQEQTLEELRSIRSTLKTYTFFAIMLLAAIATSCLVIGRYLHHLQ